LTGIVKSQRPPDPNKDFEIFADASIRTISSILVQREDGTGAMYGFVYLADAYAEADADANAYFVYSADSE